MLEVIGIDHVYLAVSDLTRSEVFYDRVFLNLDFRKNKFAIDGEPHIQYYNKLFGFVLRPAKSKSTHDPYSPGLHHFCLRVDSPADVERAVAVLREAGVAMTDARHFPEYAADYVATFLTDPDGVRLEITNYRAERRERYDRWRS